MLEKASFAVAIPVLYILGRGAGDLAGPCIDGRHLAATVHRSLLDGHGAVTHSWTGKKAPQATGQLGSALHSARVCA